MGVVDRHLAWFRGVAVQDLCLVGSKEHAARDQGFAGACPSCGGSQLHYAEGCMKCVSCGYSDCG